MLLDIALRCRLGANLKNIMRLTRTFQYNMRRIAALLVLLGLIGGFWLLPIRGQILVITDPSRSAFGTWPQVWVDPPVTRFDEQMTIYVRDNAPWPYVKLLVDGVEARRDGSFPSGSGPWTWRWKASPPTTRGYSLVFYHSCNEGCIERGRVTFGSSPSQDLQRPALRMTKLGVVFANAGRNWHGRAGWTVELTYMERQNDDVDFSIDGLAQRTQQAAQQGLRVLVRVAYDRKQALPPTGDEVALEHFLDYTKQLARDDRLKDVYGYIIGAGFNTSAENTYEHALPTTPEWYARVFNGYNLPPERTDNVVQTMRAINPRVRIIVGPVAPWNTDQNAALVDPKNMPWLNYMNTLVAYIDTATHEHQQHGIPLVGPDGFAVRAPGQIDAPEVVANPAREPLTSLSRPGWKQARAGFRVYQDWLDIINRYPSTHGLPVYITSTNVVADATQAPPTQTYPEGWLTAALDQIDHEPQVQALCWFVDQSLGNLWDDFSLSQHPGNLNAAAMEFDRLLQR